MGHVIGGKPKGGAQPDTGVKPPVIVLAVVLLVLFIGGLAYTFLGSHSGHVTPRPLSTNESWLEKVARESGGDFNKLNDQDKQRLYSIAGPSAPATLRMTYQAKQQSN